MCLCVCTHIWVCMCVCVCVHAQVCRCICVSLCACTSVYKHVCVIVCMHALVCRCTCVCAAYMHAYVSQDNLPVVLQILPALWLYLFVCLVLIWYEIVSLTGLELAELAVWLASKFQSYLSLPSQCWDYITISLCPGFFISKHSGVSVLIPTLARHTFYW